MHFFIKTNASPIHLITVKLNTRFYTRQSEHKPGLLYIMADFRFGYRLRLSTQIQVKEGGFDSKKEELKGRNPEIQKLNTKLADIKSEAGRIEREKIDAGLILTKTELKSAILKKINPTKAERLLPKPIHKKTNNFLVYLRDYVSRNPKKIKDSSLKTYEYFITVCEGFESQMGKDTFLFDNIRLKWRGDFTNYLFKSKNYSINTEDKWIKCLKCIMRYAQREGYHTNTDYEFFDRKQEESFSIALTEEEINDIYNLKLPPNLEGSRDLFVFNARSGGIRISDGLGFQKENWKGDFIEIEPKKTSSFGQRLRIPLHKQAKFILEKYTGELPKMREQQLNDNLKIIGAMIDSLHKKEVYYTSKGGIKKKEVSTRYALLTNHTARRTWCTLAIKAGLPKVLVMAISGHRKESSFNKYVKLEQSDKAELLLEEMKKIGWI